MKVYLAPYYDRKVFTEILDNIHDKMNNSTYYSIGFMDKLYFIANYLDECRIMKFIQKLFCKDKVIIHDYDLWNLDISFAQIIAPALEKMKRDSYGTPEVDEEDVPKEYSGEAAWSYVIDEMIWTFNYIADAHAEHARTYEETLECDKRAENGLRLFGKYFRALWN